jgi:hypothetical protein
MKVFHQSVKACGFFKGIQIPSQQIFRKGHFRACPRAYRQKSTRNSFHPDKFGGAKSPLSQYKLVFAPNKAHHQRREHPVAQETFGELGQILRGKIFPWLIRIWVNGIAWQKEQFFRLLFLFPHI